MGLLNKLKNALFEEEEIEIDSTPEKVVIKDEEPTIDKKKEVKQEIPPLENERELFKAENTFNFPDFDEEEFVSNFNIEKEEIKIEKRKEPEKIKKMENVYNENKGKISREHSITRKEKNKVKIEKVEKKFTPSPIISPVYGILDKNYKKEDIIKVEKTKKEQKIIDVDMVRKKAFGTLEDDIEKTLNESMDTFYNEKSKSIDELLNDSIDDTIEITYDEVPKHSEEFTNSIEEELDKVEDHFVTEDKKAKQEEEYLENNTLENDLFDLIDSMYDNREEEE